MQQQADQFYQTDQERERAAKLRIEEVQCHEMALRSELEKQLHTLRDRESCLANEFDAKLANCKLRMEHNLLEM